MTGEKTTRELVYETNRDVKWICKMLQRMEAQDEEFEARIRALEGWRSEKAGEERRVSTISAGAGGVVGGGVAVIVRGLGGGGERSPPSHVHRPIFRRIYAALCFIKTDQKFSDVPCHIGSKRDAPESDRADYHRVQQNTD